jgi:hypothetical protein
MKIFFALCLFFAVPAFAQEQAPEVPVMSFEQQVDIVVTAKQDPRLLDVKINQDKALIDMSLIVDKNTDGPQAKQIALTMVMLAKSKSLDDPPKEKNKPGVGIYDYRVALAYPDGVVLVTAYKAAKKDALSFEDPFHMEPLTRGDAAGR